MSSTPRKERLVEVLEELQPHRLAERVHVVVHKDERAADHLEVLKKTRKKQEQKVRYMGNVGVRHMGEMGAVGGDIKYLALEQILQMYQQQLERGRRVHVVRALGGGGGGRG